MAKRSGVLEFAVLGLLQDAPMHGYELRKRLNAVLGPIPGDLLRLALPVLEGPLATGLSPRTARPMLARQLAPAAGPRSSTG